MLTGRVVRFDEVRGYGFIAPDDGGEDVFVHANTIGEDKHVFTPGLPVEFEATEGDRGRKALVVRVLRGLLPAAPPPEADGLSAAAFRHEVTELLLDAAPTMTGAQIVHVRESLVAAARRHGWISG